MAVLNGASLPGVIGQRSFLDRGRDLNGWLNDRWPVRWFFGQNLWGHGGRTVPKDQWPGKMKRQSKLYDQNWPRTMGRPRQENRLQSGRALIG